LIDRNLVSRSKMSMLSSVARQTISIAVVFSVTSKTMITVARFQSLVVRER